jgi:hypothetical protein
VIVLFGEDGYMADEIIVPREDMPQVLRKLNDLMQSHGLRTLDVWTSDRDIFALLLDIPGINVQIKHPSDTDSTRVAIKSNAEILMDIFNISKLPPLPGWRKKIATFLKKLLNYVEGNGKYEV